LAPVWAARLTAKTFSNNGAWQAGVAGALPGAVMLAAPAVGDGAAGDRYVPPKNGLIFQGI
jgi:hypothetical protein